MDLEKAFGIVPGNVLELVIRKKVILEILVRSVMSLYDRAKTKVRVVSELSEKFELEMHNEYVLSHFLFAAVVDFVTELARVLGGLLFADDLVLMSETIEGFSIKFRKWKEVFESNGLNVYLG